MHLYHYEGEKNPVPPTVEVHEGMPSPLIKKLQQSIESAYSINTRWLVDVITNIKGELPQAEWPGYMSSAAKQKEEQSNCVTKFIFGPLINAPQSNPDTVLTTLLYIERFLK